MPKEHYFPKKIFEAQIENVAEVREESAHTATAAAGCSASGGSRTTAAAKSAV